MILSFSKEVIFELKSEEEVHIIYSWVTCLKKQAHERVAININFLAKVQQQRLTWMAFFFIQEKLCWVRTGRLASGTLSFCPVQIYGCRGLAAPPGYGNYVIRLVWYVVKAQDHYFIKLPDQNILNFLEDVTIWVEIGFTGKCLHSPLFYKSKWQVIFWLLFLSHLL